MRVNQNLANKNAILTEILFILGNSVKKVLL